jgi:hypothetical protein
MGGRGTEEPKTQQTKRMNSMLTAGTGMDWNELECHGCKTAIGTDGSGGLAGRAALRCGLTLLHQRCKTQKQQHIMKQNRTACVMQEQSPTTRRECARATDSRNSQQWARNGANDSEKKKTSHLKQKCNNNPEAQTGRSQTHSKLQPAMAQIRRKQAVPSIDFMTTWTMLLPMLACAGTRTHSAKPVTGSATKTAKTEAINGDYSRRAQCDSRWQTRLTAINQHRDGDKQPIQPGQRTHEKLSQNRN